MGSRDLGTQDLQGRFKPLVLLGASGTFHSGQHQNGWTSPLPELPVTPGKLEGCPNVDEAGPSQGKTPKRMQVCKEDKRCLGSTNTVLIIMDSESS